MCLLNPKKRWQRDILGILCLMIIPLSGMGLDIYLPSLPAVSKYFHVNRDYVQLSLSTYMLGLALAQFLAGPISDTYGRKKPFFFSVIIFIVASFLVPQSQDIMQLLILRFFQGAAAATAIVPMRSVISDMYDGRERDKMVSYMAVSWSVGPIIAPVIGGYLQHYYGWKASFHFLGAYVTLLSIALFICLPETSKHRLSFKPIDIAKRYACIFVHREFLIGLFVNSLLYSTFIVFSVVGPFLIQRDMGYSAVDFGHFALILGITWFLGALANRFLVDVPLVKKERVSLFVILVICLMMLAAAYHYPLNIYTIIVPTSLLLFFVGVIFPSNFSRLFALFPKATASANALFGGMLFANTAITAALSTMLDGHNAVQLAGAYVGLVLAAIVLHFLRHK